MRNLFCLLTALVLATSAFDIPNFRRWYGIEYRQRVPSSSKCEQFDKYLKKVKELIIKGIKDVFHNDHIQARVNIEHVPAKENIEHVPAKEIMEHVPAKENIEHAPAKENTEHVPAKENIEYAPAKSLVRVQVPVE
ncbi:uncharacterized protein LOC105848777 [Hydra vulgaris]|uniref:uncharacterized protein LOC105848777 n=1 Tax=Hydra vulgaris TaxID=6087 RepID=UPI001F5FC4AA|nr:uncharacterized protein LOC105848777 [Hydra vulgaris]